jgi:hypothetical protein
VTSSSGRVCGALIGQAVGGALGAPTEGLIRARIVAGHTPPVTAGHRWRRPGPLDDGAVARAVPVGIRHADRPERAAASEQHPAGANGGGPRD